MSPDAFYTAWIGAVATVGIGLIALAYQILQKRKDDIQRERDEIKRRKLAVVADIVSYRFAMVNGNRGTAFDKSKINAAICRIPIEFIDDHDVLDMYRSLGTEFNPTKLVRIVNAMVKAADPSQTAFDFNVLNNVPSVDITPFDVVLWHRPPTAAPAATDNK